ncbi:MAG: PAS domain-containing protein [Myxococcales bacterium]|nr:PAS domain-containing protein [Myxococcales bacterium]
MNQVITEIESVERIAHLTREEVDALPYGLMVFDVDGTVHLYNRYESLLSRREPDEVIGRSWFRDVAPCTRVAAFEGRFRAFVARGDRSEVVRFGFRFHFLHGAQDVEVTFAHAPDPGRVFVIVARRVLSDTGEPLDVTVPVTTSVDDGRARGGLGAALAPPRSFWSRLFDAVDGPALDAAAEAWGEALLEGAEAYAERVHGKPLSGLSTLLAVALIDDAFAAQGLGRVELDFGGRERGVLGFAVRAVDLPAGMERVLYPAVLRAVARGLTGHDLECFVFGHRGEFLRIAATTADKVAVLRGWSTSGVATDEIAQRAGLEVWR